jgi:hypothetical protein
LRKGQETRVGEGLGLDAGATGEGGGGEAQEQSEDAAGKLQREVTGMMMGGGEEEEEENKGRRSARERYIWERKRSREITRGRYRPGERMSDGNKREGFFLASEISAEAEAALFTTAVGRSSWVRRAWRRYVSRKTERASSWATWRQKVVSSSRRRPPTASDEYFTALCETSFSRG